MDLRDGNQGLAVPMNVSQKLEMFDALVQCGFQHIEIGFPSASNTEFAFSRCLIEEGRIPDHVTVQVLVQAREDLIERTVESLIGAKRCVIHLYNSASRASPAPTARWNTPPKASAPRKSSSPKKSVRPSWTCGNPRRSGR